MEAQCGAELYAENGFTQADSRHLVATCGLERGLRDYPFTQLSLGFT